MLNCPQDLAERAALVVAEHVKHGGARGEAQQPLFLYLAFESVHDPCVKPHSGEKE